MPTPALDERREPQYNIQIGGRNFDKVLYNRFVESIVATQETELMPICKIRLDNSKLELTNDKLWSEGTEISITMGTSETGLEDIGNYLIQKPSFEFSSKDNPIITILGVGEIGKMVMSGEKRRKFKEVTDSDIARKIANEYGFETEIEETEDVYPEVVQVNQTDADFLRERAKLYGYRTYVHNGVLHFHPLRFNNSDIRFIYNSGEESNVRNAEFKINTYRKAVQVRKTQINPITEELIEATSDPDIRNEISKRLNEEENIDMNYDDLTSQNRAKFLVNSGHSQQQEEVNRQVQAAAQESRWVVDGSVETFGVESITAGEMVEIAGVERFDGLYYIPSCIHEMRDSYSIDFDVMKTGTKATDDGLVLEGERVSRERMNVTDNHAPEQTFNSQTKRFESNE